VHYTGALRPALKQLSDFQVTDHREHRRDMTVRQGADDRKGVWQVGTGRGVTLKNLTEGFDLRGGPVGEVGEGAGFLTLPCSRKASRKRIAGGDLRFGTRATYMPTIDQ
jgi:hypothetical protein